MTWNCPQTTEEYTAPLTAYTFATTPVSHPSCNLWGTQLHATTSGLEPGLFAQSDGWTNDTLLSTVSETAPMLRRNSVSPAHAFTEDHAHSDPGVQGSPEIKRERYEVPVDEYFPAAHMVKQPNSLPQSVAPRHTSRIMDAVTIKQEHVLPSMMYQFPNYEQSSPSPLRKRESADTADDDDESEETRRRRRNYTTEANAKCRCNLCGKLFQRTYNLKAHQDTHNPHREMPFPCRIQGCNKRFVRKTDLTRHHMSVSALNAMLLD